ncbi:MAG: transglycosylase SLT domain-containing protein [bacterium]
MRTRLLAALAALALSSPAHAEKAAEKRSVVKSAPADRMAALEKRLAELEAEVAARPRDVSAYNLPDKVSFCGVAVDLDDPDIRERLEREFYMVLGDRAQVVLWIKRARSVFPVIDREAKALGTCSDLKYVSVVESGLRPAVESRASAKGWWQFMSATGRQYGLDVDRAWDQRADLDEATRAGLTYLAELHGYFGSWPLALAAYNTGRGRLSRAQAEQGVTDFWQLDLYSEAERYVPRAIAIKTVMEDLAGYGFQIELEDGYAPEPRGFVKIEIPAGQEIEVLAAARGAEIPVRTLRRMNPEMGTEVFPSGREVVIEVPPGREGALRGWLTGEVARLAKAQKAPKKPRVEKRSAVAKRSAPATRAKAVAAPAKRSASRSRGEGKSGGTYQVQAGDSLWSIAQKSGCSVDELRSWNKLDNKSVLRPGQTLKVRR